MANYVVCLVVLLKVWQCEATGPVMLALERKSSHVKGPEGFPHFVAKVQLGSEAEDMEVLFETGSGSLVMDSTKCKAAACLKHHRYSPSHAGLDRFGEAKSFGERARLEVDEGDFWAEVSGNMVREKICLQALCLQMGMLAVSNMTDPFIDADGIVGMSLEGLSISKPFNFLQQLPAAGLSSQFAIFLPTGPGAGEITFGGYNPARLESSLTWVPVQNPQDGFWQIEVVAVFAGSEKLELCEEGCLAFIDSSSPYIQVPEEKLHLLTERSVLSCDARNQDLSLVLKNGMRLSLSAKDYADCTQRLHPWKKEEQQNTGVRKEGPKVVVPGGVNSNSLILGMPLLQKYYTVFDALKKSVAFGLAKQDFEEDLIMLMQGKMAAKQEL